VASDPADRKLAAILSADVVGYSRLMAEDEAETVRTLTAYRDIVSMLVQQHRGRVVDSPGDNLLAEFPTATDAVEAAAEIQRVIQARNATVPVQRMMEFRIGVHLGEVRTEGERIYGDGVNIAARLEGLAEAGGICISDMVHQQVRHKLELTYEDLGEKEVKNIPEPIQAYQVRPETGVATQKVEPRAGPWALLVAGAVVLLVVAGSLVWRLSTTTRSIAPSDEQFSVPGFGGAPAIAVLPFEDMSRDGDQEYFADGIAEDLITRLSAQRGFPVIARNSSFVYKGKAVDVKQVSRELGARYLVEGSVRKAGDRVRVSAQLIESTTGHHVWAETYDRELRDIFAVQDEITAAIVAAMSPELQEFEWRRLVRQEPRNLDAYDRMARGMWHLRQPGRDENARARSLFEQAIELDPSSAGAFAGLALTHFNDVQYQWTSAPDRSISELRRAAQRSVALDPRLSQGQLIMAFAHQLVGERDDMIGAVERAIEVNPSNALGHAVLGLYLSQTGRPEETFPHIERAMRLSPRDPAFWLFFYSEATAHFGLRQYERTAERMQRSLRHRPDYFLSWGILAASQAHLGRLDDARSALGEVLRLQPELSEASLERFFVYADRDWFERFVDGLRRAGWQG
jgi:adenylate cyclase